MARRIVWTETAWLDLESIAEFLTQESPHYAIRFVQEVRKQARSLTELSLRGRIVPELDDPTVRELLFKKYRLLYQVEVDGVYILAVIHGARDLATLWHRRR